MKGQELAGVPSILILCDDSRGHANTVLDHIRMFEQYSAHKIHTFNPRRLKGTCWLDLDEFDVVVIHYSVVIISDQFLAPAFREQLRLYQGLKVQFIQDECRWVNAITAMMRYLGIHIVFTLLPEKEVRKVYNDSSLPGVLICHTLAGYVPDNLIGLSTPPVEARPIDIGYRGRTLPYWLGELAQEKLWIGQGVRARAPQYGLRCDIAWGEQDRIYGSKWIGFLASCKATLGTESGASITDFDGLVEKRTKRYLAEHPEAAFADVQQAVLSPYEGNVYMNQISPKIFEAAALRTALVLFPGEYSGILHPWLHYIPLKRDFSNIREVAEKVRDVAFLRTLTETAYGDLVASGAYSCASFVRQFDETISRMIDAVKRRRKAHYHVARIRRRIALAGIGLKRAWNVPAAVIKAVIVLELMMRTYGGKKLLRYMLAHGMDLGLRGLRPLCCDLLRLAIVARAQTGAVAGNTSFRISNRFNEEHGLMFVSRPRDQNHSDACAERDPLFNRSSLESVVRQSKLRRIVWDHSPVTGEVRFPVTRSRGLSIDVTPGEYDMYQFTALEGLAGRFPGYVWDLLDSAIGATPGKAGF